MSEIQSGNPYKPLGNCLKQLRIKHQRTLAEVSGAVEIDIETLKDIEKGKTRPAEDILLLLISHFGIKDDEAAQLWLLAGYEPPKDDSQDDAANKQLMVMMPLDNRTLLTDEVHVHGNKHAVIMSFMQTDYLTYQSVPVARMGMTTEQAKQLFEQLRRMLYYAEPKALPAPKTKTNKSN